MGRSRYVVTEPDQPHFLTCTVGDWLPVFSRPELVEIVASQVALTPKDQRRVASFNLRFRLVRSSEAQKADAANEVVAGK